MKQPLAALLALSISELGAAPILADAKANARANCTGEILASSDVTRNEIKTFTLNKSGDGYELVGHTETHQFVSCKADADGTATFVSVR